MCLWGWIFGFDGGDLWFVVMVGNLFGARWLLVSLGFVVDASVVVLLCYVVVCLGGLVCRLRLGVYVVFVFIDALHLWWICGAADLPYGCGVWCFGDFLVWWWFDFVVWGLAGLVC